MQHGFLLQVDVNPNGGNHKAEGKWDNEEHLNQATGILVYFIKKIQNKFPDWDAEQKLKGLYYSCIILSQKSSF